MHKNMEQQQDTGIWNNNKTQAHGTTTRHKSMEQQQDIGTWNNKKGTINTDE